MIPSGRAPRGIEVWFAPLAATDTAVEAGLATLAREERVRASRLHLPADRRRFVVSHAALRAALADRTGLALPAIEVRYGPCGKPWVAGGGRLEFSMSRAGEVAAFAFATSPVGIDIVAMSSGARLLEAAPEFCSPAELDSIGDLTRSRRMEALARAWTRKEALLKATGEGLTRSPAGVPVMQDPRCAAGECIVRVAGRTWRIQDVPAPTGYRSALAHRLP